MKLFFDIRLGYLVAAPASSQAQSDLYFKAGDLSEIVLQFGQSSDPTSSESFFQSPTWTAENLSGGSNIKLGVKQSGVYADGELLAGSAIFAHDDVAKTYTFDLSLNTEQIDTALFRMDETAENDVDSLSCQFEVTYQPGGYGGWRSSVLPVGVTIYHDILSGAENSPTNAEDPAAYALKSEIINVPEDATTVGNIVLFNSTGGKEITDSGVAIAALAPALGVDDNYVTAAEKTVIENTSGTNTGDNAANSLYSGIVTNATHTGDVTGATELTISNGSVTKAKCSASVNASLDLADSSIQPGNAALTDDRVPTAAGLSSKFGTNKATIVDGDKFAILDSAATDEPKHSLFSLVKSVLKTYFDALYAAALGADDNYVTDAEKVVIGNTSGTNTGDQNLSGYVLTNAIDTLAELNAVVTDATLIDTSDARLSDARTPTAHTHEGAAILSTGEAGGTKFLREDGDGTCSWQTLAGGGDAMTSNPLSQFAATTSSQLASVISDETGSGSLVFATSPTLVTPTLGTPSSGTLTNCTGLPTEGLVDDAVTLAKMAIGTSGRLISYDIFGNPATVAAGSLGQVLTSNHGSGTPTFKTILPAGLVSPYAGTAAPTGWLLCAGQTVSRTTYADLFAAVSTAYGAGDGSTTFALPDLRGRVPAGKDNMGGTDAGILTNALTNGVDGDTLGAVGGNDGHQLSVTQMPAHTHASGFNRRSDMRSGGSVTVMVGAGSTINVTSASTGGNAEHNNVQPTIILNYIIKT